MYVRLFFLIILVATSSGFCADPQPYQLLGNKLDSEFRLKTARTERVFQQLHKALLLEAPDLVPELLEINARRDISGYQQIPAITRSKTVPALELNPRIQTFSWHSTQQSIGLYETALASFEKRLEHEKLQNLRKGGWLSSFTQVKSKERAAKRLIDYNWLWQKQAAEPRFKKYYDHRAILGNQTLLLKQFMEKREQQGMSHRADTSLNVAIAHLQGVLSNASPLGKLPPYVQLLESPKEITYKVLLHSDILDGTFLQHFESIVEQFWQLDIDGRKHRVDLSVVRVNPKDIYPKGAPKPGEKIQIESHKKRFSKRVAVLTSGARSTHCVGGNVCALGPHPIRARTLAHEFGHLLGFQDAYFRSFRDLGEWGYEVQEAIPNRRDIMASPAKGNVLEQHFQQMFALWEKAE